MIKKPTSELMDALTTSTSIDKYIKSEGEHFIDEPLFSYLSKLTEEKGLKKSQVIKDAEMNEIYGYQIFSGSRVPSRDKLLSLAFGMRLSLDETQQLLKYAGFSPLYPKSERDSILIWCINHALSLCETNEQLYTHSHDTL